jgi:hypothetical protein
VRQACEDCFDAHLGDCSGFACAVSNELGVPLEGLANQTVGTLRRGNGWRRLQEGRAAVLSAAAGKPVIGGLKGSEQTHPDAHGHVVAASPAPLPAMHIRERIGES